MNAASAPEISVIVATQDRAAILARTLEHLFAQAVEGAAFEILVVDDGSRDGTPEVARSAAARSPVALRYLAHVRRGVAFTHNRGVREARAPLVLLLADDILLAPGAVAAHVALHRAHPDPRVAALGWVVQSPELRSTAFGRAWGGFGLERFEHLDRLPYPLFWSFNLSFKRSFAIANGLFDESLGRAGPACHEDTEFGYRLHRAGMTLLPARKALGEHFHPATLAQVAARFRERGLNYGELAARVPDPALAVFFRLLVPPWDGAYRRALRECWWLAGRERSFAWHAFRHALRAALFNAVTVPRFWRPLLARGDGDDWLARAIPAGCYAPYLFHHFLAGVAEARRRYAPAGASLRTQGGVR